MRRDTHDLEVVIQARSELEHYHRHAECQSDEFQQSQAELRQNLERSNAEGAQLRNLCEETRTANARFARAVGRPQTRKARLSTRVSAMQSQMQKKKRENQVNLKEQDTYLRSYQPGETLRNTTSTKVRPHKDHQLQESHCRLQQPGRGRPYAKQSTEQWCPKRRQRPKELGSRNFRIQIHSWFDQMNFKSGVCSSSSFPTEAVVWINEIDSARNMDELISCKLIFGAKHSRLDSKIASALKKLLTAGFKRRVYMEEQKAQQDNRFLKARQIA